jgi:hypothetical protein
MDRNLLGRRGVPFFIYGRLFLSFPLFVLILLKDHGFS